MQQGDALLELGCEAVLMKGGHLSDAESPDWRITVPAASALPHRAFRHTHGTGCRCRRRWRHCDRAMDWAAP